MYPPKRPVEKVVVGKESECYIFSNPRCDFIVQIAVEDLEDGVIGYLDSKIGQVIPMPEFLK